MTIDRKAPTRRDKEARRPMGAFRLRSTSNDKYVIGSSGNLPAMLNRQRFQLEAGVHPNPELQVRYASARKPR